MLQKLKYVRLCLAKEIKDFYNETNKTLIEEIDEYTKNEKTFPTHESEELILVLVKCQQYQK
jgi:hypothetical protein